MADVPGPAAAIARAVKVWAENAERPEPEPEAVSAPPYLTLANGADDRRETGVFGGAVTAVGAVLFDGEREIARLVRGRWQEPDGRRWRALVFEPLSS
jgi:hypothetical protein